MTSLPWHLISCASFQPGGQPTRNPGSSALGRWRLHPHQLTKQRFTLRQVFDDLLPGFILTTLSHFLFLKLQYIITLFTMMYLFQVYSTVIQFTVCVLFQILFPYRFLQNVKYCSLCYTAVGPCWLSFLCMAVCIC